MRDPNRLVGFYDQLRIIHTNYFPDWRFGQLIYNFIVWLSNEKKIDCFFPEENQMIKYLEEYATGVKE